LAELLCCSRCGRKLSSQAAQRIGGQVVCPRCVPLMKAVVQAQKADSRAARAPLVVLGLPAWLVGGAVAVAVLVGFVCAAAFVAGSKRKAKPPAGLGIKYQMISDKKYDAPVKAQVTIKVLVSSRLGREDLKRLLMHLYAAAMARRGFKYHERATNVYIYAYTSRENAEAGWSWVAMLDKSYSDSAPKVSYNEEELNAVRGGPVVKFGLTEVQRKKVFAQMGAAEGKARREAEKEHPVRPGDGMDKIKAQIDYERERQAIYKKAIRDKYKLSKDQMRAIVIEGVTRRWPH